MSAQRVYDVGFRAEIDGLAVDVVADCVDLESEEVDVLRIARADDERKTIRFSSLPSNVRARICDAAVAVAEELWDHECGCDRLAEEAGDMEREAN